MRFAALLILLAFSVTAAQAAPPEKAVEPPTVERLRIDGVNWTAVVDGVTIRGILQKPPGDGPFPAIIVSHGLGGSIQDMLRLRGRELVADGFVCIGVDYTHARSEMPQDRGAGRRTAADFARYGDSPENIRRALACLEILKQQPYVDSSRVAAFGHSMGAFVTVGLMAAAPDAFLAAAITAGGIAPEHMNVPAPSPAVAAKVRTPMLILHGATDTTVRPQASELLKRELDRNNVPNERHVFEGVGHALPPQTAAEVHRLMRQWFTRHGVLLASDAAR